MDPTEPKTEMGWNNLHPAIRGLAATILTTRQHAALRLREDGLSYREIALHLNCTVSTAYDAVTTARRKLHHHLKEQP